MRTRTIQPLLSLRCIVDHLPLLEHVLHYNLGRIRTQAATLNIKLPEALEQAVAECAYYETLEKCMTLPYAPFRRTNKHFVRAMAVMLQVEYYRPDELLIQQDDMSFQLFFILHGKVDVYDHSKMLRTIEAGGGLMPPIVGEMAFFIGTVQPFTVGDVSKPAMTDCP